jgi:hypothetical protein
MWTVGLIGICLFLACEIGRTKRRVRELEAGLSRLRNRLTDHVLNHH